MGVGSVLKMLLNDRFFSKSEVFFVSSSFCGFPSQTFSRSRLGPFFPGSSAKVVDTCSLGMTGVTLLAESSSSRALGVTLLLEVSQDSRLGVRLLSRRASRGVTLLLDSSQLTPESSQPVTTSPGTA